jgi:trimeric autotransporter adhesin
VDTGILSQNSDLRLKKNIIPLSNTIKSLQQLNGYTYNWKDEKRDSTQQIGLIAQEVQKVYPQLVKQNADENLSLNYIGLVPVLLEGIKEQQKEIEELKQAVKKLQNK